MKTWARWFTFVGIPALLTALLAAPVFAVPYVPLDVAQQQARERAAQQPVGPIRHIPSELNEFEGYVYPVRYTKVLNWLPGMQVVNTGILTGGMREGEQDLDIIQTDNTQEAVRDWSYYGRLTGDTTHFRQNIDDGWTYILNWPAYLEEGGDNPNYYRVHNCGWGLMAVMEYTKTYGDSTYIAYGDSCARYIDDWRLSWSGNGVEMNPLVAGFGAGALYLYAQWRNNDDWVQAAQEIATGVRTWIEDDPDRLNNNEVWAMSGGTAMWGVVTALYLDNPDSAAVWIPTYTPYMDTYAGPGQWNNSWTIWYGHAWNQIHHILGDSASYDNAVETVDFLLDQDDVDQDGGVPATEGQYRNDQSWTSAYLVWYGLEPIMEADSIGYDAVAYKVAEPAPTARIISGIPTELNVVVANGGLQPLAIPNQQAFVSLQVNGETVSSTSVSVPFGTAQHVILPEMWTPADTGATTLTLIATTPNDERPSNDTLTVTVNVSRMLHVNGTVTDLDSGDPLEARVSWVELGTEFPLQGDTLTSPDDGSFQLPVSSGEFEVTVTPTATPYHPAMTQTVTLTDQDEELDFQVPVSRVMLVSMTGANGVDSLNVKSLKEAGLVPYVWSVPDRGLPLDSIGPAPVVIWSATTLESDIIDTTQRASIDSYLQNGGRMMLMGQGVMNALGDDPWLQSTFGVESGSLDRATFYLIGNDHPITQGDTLMLAGAAPAGLPDVVAPGQYSETILRFPNVDLSAGVAHEGEGGSYRTVLLGFGAESIYGTDTRFVSRDVFFDRAVEWLGGATSAPEPGADEARPQAWTLNAYPNPFNPSLTIQVAAPGNGKAHLSVYDLLGRRVAAWELGASGGRVVWDAKGVASGVYFIRLEAGKVHRVRRVTLLR